MAKMFREPKPGWGMVPGATSPEGGSRTGEIMAGSSYGWNGCQIGRECGVGGGKVWGRDTPALLPPAPSSPDGVTLTKT